MARLVAARLPGGELRRAWEVILPTRVELLSALRCLVNAEDGAGLGVNNGVRTANQARVFEIDPAISGDTLLRGVPNVLGTATYLDDGLVKGENCVDQHQRVAVSFGGTTNQLHICSEVQSAARDPISNDWSYAAVTGTGAAKTGNGDGTTPFEVDAFDEFAEVSMYYQVRKAYDVFKTMAGTRQLLHQQPIPAIANFREAFGGTGSFQQQLANATDPNGTLYPFDNAAFAPHGPLIPGVDRNYDSMLFGQGTYVDFAYDGLTIYHEFTHAVIDSSVALKTNRLDRWGLDNAPSAMNEGYADFFAGAISGHANLDAYLGPAFDQMGVERRVLDNLTMCPSNLQGEPHHDSMPWSAALWAARVELGTSPERLAAYDLDVYHALIGLTQQPSFGAAAMATITELMNDTTFSAADVNAARTKFTDRGQIACERVVHYQMPVPLAFLEGTQTGDVAATPYMPGYFQWRYDVPEDARGLDVTIEAAQGGGFGGGTLQPRVLVRRGADPMQFTYAGSTVTGNDDGDLMTPMEKQGQGYVAHVVGNIAAGPVHVMIVNTGTASAELMNVEIQSLPGTIYMDAAVEVDAAISPDAAVKPPGGGGGCGCRAAGAGGARGALGLLGFGLALLVVRRRRRVAYTGPGARGQGVGPLPHGSRQQGGRGTSQG